MTRWRPSASRTSTPPSSAPTRDRIAVAGDSAGGNLAAVVAQLAAAGGGPAPVFQALVYPVTDYSQKRQSYDTFAEGFFLTRAEMDYFREHYFAGADNRSDPRASPILTEDLSGLPPAHIVTAGFDPLRDEGEDYARRLQEAGVLDQPPPRARPRPRLHQRRRRQRPRPRGRGQDRRGDPLGAGTGRTGTSGLRGARLTVAPG